MAYKKRRSTALEKAQTRLRGLQSLDPAMDLGSGVTLQDYATLIATASTQLQTYNVALADADRTRIELEDIETNLKTMSSRILSMVVAMYGRTSKEYEMAGGKLRSPAKRTKTAGATSMPSATGTGVSMMAIAAPPESTPGAEMNGNRTNGAIAMH
jgi:hypothetical protein